MFGFKVFYGEFGEESVAEFQTVRGRNKWLEERRYPASWIQRIENPESSKGNSRHELYKMSAEGDGEMFGDFTEICRTKSEAIFSANNCSAVRVTVTRLSDGKVVFEDQEPGCGEDE